MNKRLAEIALRVKEIEEIATRGEATDEISIELDTLLEERKALIAKDEEIRSKINEGLQVYKPSDNRSKVGEDMEYRMAFRDYVMGKNTEALSMRADATTATTDIGAIIPTTIMNMIIDKMTDVGDIWALVTKTNYKGGLDVPVGNAKPTASWIAEGSVADKQKKALGKVSFSYYKLQIRVATTIVADSVSLNVFESNIAENIAEAMVLALEAAILNGTGVGQPLGITVDTDIPAAQIVEFAVADATYTGWLTKLISSIPLAYRKSKKGKITMNPATFDNYVWGLVDDNGQPLARMTYGVDGSIVYRLLGYEVILREEIAALSATTPASTVVATYCVYSDYIVNSNLSIQTRRYFDEDTDEYVQKSTLICDGKLGDKNGVVLLKTAAA